MASVVLPCSLPAQETAGTTDTDAMRQQQRTESPEVIVEELQIRGVTTNIRIPTTLYPSRWLAAVLLGICSVFVFIGILMIRKGETMGFYAGGFFALGLPIFAFQFHPKAF